MPARKASMSTPLTGVPVRIYPTVAVEGSRARKEHSAFGAKGVVKTNRMNGVLVELTEKFGIHSPGAMFEVALPEVVWL